MTAALSLLRSRRSEKKVSGFRASVPGGTRSCAHPPAAVRRAGKNNKLSIHNGDSN